MRNTFSILFVSFATKCENFHRVVSLRVLPFARAFFFLPPFLSKPRHISQLRKYDIPTFVYTAVKYSQQYDDYSLTIRDIDFKVRRKEEKKEGKKEKTYGTLKRNTGASSPRFFFFFSVTELTVQSRRRRRRRRRTADRHYYASSIFRQYFIGGGDDVDRREIARHHRIFCVRCTELLRYVHNPTK